MKFKLAVVLLALVPLIFVGQACNRVSYGADDKSKIHVGIVFDIGGKDDRSFNAAAWAGVSTAPRERAIPARMLIAGTKKRRWSAIA